MNGKDSFDPWGLWLSQAEGIGTRTALRLFGAFRRLSGEEGEKSVYELAQAMEKSGFARQLYEMGEKDLRDLSRAALGERGAMKVPEILKKAKRISPQEAAEDLSRRGMAFVSLEDPAYPARLRAIPDMPLGLYYKGRLPDPSAPAAAVIGSRRADRYGLEQAERFAAALARQGVSVISGMALGVDGAAGRAALKAGGASFAVLGSGADVCYPPANRDLYDLLSRRGGILSEYVPGTQARPGLFPPRNRIISGLSDLVLVIEARAGSGTLITTDYALAQGREVFALPGRVTDPLSEGCNRLLSQGASIALDPKDLTERFFGIREGDPPRKKKKEEGGSQRKARGIHEIQQMVFSVLSEERPMCEAEILLRCGSGIWGLEENLGSALMLLVLQDLAEEREGGYIKRPGAGEPF